MSYSISASLKRDGLAQQFNEQSWLSIHGVLPDENARRVHKILRDQTPWNFVFNDRDRSVDLSTEQLRSLPAGKLRELQQAIYNQARDGFQYCYNNYPLYDSYLQGVNTEHPLQAFYKFLRSEVFLGLVREVTGLDDIAYPDAQATCFNAGHFLSTHDDVAEGKNRRCAYILNFTPDWSPDWGGYLQLLDGDGNIRRGLLPSFNTLNIIAIPQSHNVSLVAPFAPRSRLSISGWMRYGDEG